jgi:hypothetical protein
VEVWVTENWDSPCKFIYCGNGFILFIFYSEEERDKIFRSGPYFMSTRGIFLSHWTLDFDQEMEILVAPVWVKLPHLPVIF